MTISGYGFGMSGLKYIRVQFGEVIQRNQVVSLTPDKLVVEAPWGTEGEALVTVALNGVSFASDGGAPLSKCLPW